MNSTLMRWKTKLLWKGNKQQRLLYRCYACMYIAMHFEQLCSNSHYICNLCFRLLAQLDETENAFEQFWSKHHLKLEQCLQLRHFEQDFREVKYVLLSAWLSLPCSLWFVMCATASRPVGRVMFPIFTHYNEYMSSTFLTMFFFISHIYEITLTWDNLIWREPG